MKAFPKFLGSLALRLGICVLAAVLLLSAVYCIPTEPMADNMWLSAQTLNEEGMTPWLYPWCTSLVDNFTDSFMLLHAVYRNEESPVVQAMNVYRPHFGTKDQPYADLIDHYINGRAYTSEITYERYWHGYLVYLKPLLCLTSYSAMRKLNALGQAAVIVLVMALMVRGRCKRFLLPYLLAMGMLNPLVTSQCLQFSSCFYTMNLSLAALLLAKDRLDAWEGRIFLYTGIATAFLDFLTYPLATLGVPAVLYFSLTQSRGWKEDLFRLVKVCFCWGFGYGGMWSSKWLVSGLITGSSQLSGILEKFRERTTGTVYGEEGGVIKAWSENWTYFWNNPVTLAVIAMAAVLVLILLVRAARKQIAAGDLLQAVPFLLLSAMPFVWYAFARNHSIMHAMPFTHRVLVILPFALACLGTKLVMPGKDPQK